MQHEMVVIKQMNPIDEFLDSIQDGNWHNLNEIKSTGAVEITKFLKKYGFVQTDKFNKKVIIDQQLKTL